MSSGPTRLWKDLEPDEKRRILLDALAAPEGSRNQVARDAGVQREHMYDRLREVRTDPEYKLEEARKEADFRREVLEYVRLERMPR